MEPSKFTIYLVKYIILGFSHMKAIVRLCTYENLLFIEKKNCPISLHQITWKSAIILVYVHGHCICVIRALNRNQKYSKEKMELFSNGLHSAGVPEPAVS